MKYKDIWKKAQKKFDEIRVRMIPVSERMYLFMLVLLTAYYMLTMTCVEIPWDKLGENFFPVHFIVKSFLLEPQYILLVIAVLRHLFSETYDWREILAAAVISRCAFYAYEQVPYIEMLVMILLMLGAKGSSFRRIVKIHFFTCLTVFVCTVIAAQTGLIENMVYQVRTERAAFGFTYPTRFAAHVLFLILWYWYLRGEEWTYQECLLPLAGSIFVKAFSDARASSWLMAALFAVMVYHVWRRQRGRRLEKPYHMNPVFSYLLAGSTILCTILITIPTMLYTSENVRMVALDGLLSSRLSLTKKGMDIFGFTLWGKWIRLAGNGGFLNGNRVYFYIDSAFLQFAIQYGVIMMSVILLLFWRVGILARKQKQWILLWVMAFIAVHGIAEPHVLRVAYNPMIFAAFAVMEGGSDLRFEKKWKRGK